MKIKRHNFLILVFLPVIIGCLLVSCSNVSFQTYQNDRLQYTIDYPENWTVHTSEDPSAIEPPVLILAPMPHLGRIAITVIEDPKFTPEQIVEGAAVILQDGLGDFAFTVKEGKTERWDLRFEGNGMTDTGTIFVFGYYKQKANYLYQIDGIADSKIWDDLLIDKIVSSFRML